jgi:hypothetical protein
MEGFTFDRAPEPREQVENEGRQGRILDELAARVTKDKNGFKASTNKLSPDVPGNQNGDCAGQHRKESIDGIAGQGVSQQAQ